MKPRDTSAEAASIQRDVIASKTGSQRTLMAFEVSELVRQVMIDGIRRRQPDLDGPGLTLALIERLHGPSVAAAIAQAGAVSGGR